MYFQELFSSDYTGEWKQHLKNHSYNQNQQPKSNGLFGPRAT